MRTDRKPPTGRSLTMSQSRGHLQPSSILTQVTPAKSTYPTRVQVNSKTELRSEFCSYSCDRCALARMVGNDSRKKEIVRDNLTPVFQRGRYYNEYSAKRNEMLMKKKLGFVDSGTIQYGVAVDVAVQIQSQKCENLEAKCGVYETPRRYMLRSMTMTEENKRSDCYAAVSERKGGRRIK